MDELEGRVVTALLARDAAAPTPRPDLGAAVVVAASRLRRRRQVTYAAAVGAAVAAVVAVPLVTGGGSDHELAPPAGGSSGRGAPLDGRDLGGAPRDDYTAALECYSYQHATGFLRPIDPVGTPASSGPRAAIEAWWLRASDIPPEWNTDVVVERTADAATEVILRADETVGAVVELARSADGWRITGVNSCV